MEKTKATRNPNLDLVRILACVAVVGLHTVRLNGSFFYVALYNICGFAVPAFFMASGYMLLNRDALRPGYVVRKIAGVLRLAVCWTVLVCLLYMLKDVLEGMSPLSRIVELPGQIVLNLLQRGHIWQFWYLGATMLVYACLPALYRLKNRRGGVKRIWACLVVAGVALEAASCFAGRPLQESVPQTFRLWTWLQYFLLGGLFGAGELPGPLRRVNGLSLKAHTVCLLAATAWIAVYQYWMGKNVLHTPKAECFYDSVFTVLWLILLFSWVMKLPISERARPAITTLSSLTLGVYILHPFVIQVIVVLLRRVGLPRTLLASAVILLLSALATFVISKIPVLNSLVRFETPRGRTAKTKNQRASA